MKDYKISREIYRVFSKKKPKRFELLLVDYAELAHTIDSRLLKMFCSFTVQMKLIHLNGE